MTRTLDDLLATDDPAWPVVERMARTAPGRVRVLPVDPRAGEAVLVALQVGADSALGAMALHSGGMLLDHGWLRLLGGGAPHLPDLASAGGVVAHDVLGGRFALGRPEAGRPGELAYWAPDSLKWEPVDLGYSAFLSWVLEVGCDPFYRDSRWPGWETEVAALSPDQGLALDPPPWTGPGHDPRRSTRTTVAFTDLVAAQEQAAGSRR